MLDQETGLRGYINTRGIEFLDPYRTGRTHLETAIADERRYGDGGRDASLIATQVGIARGWQRLAEEQVAAILAGKRPTAKEAPQRKGLMDRFRAANSSFLRHKQADRDSDRRTAQIISIVAILGLGTLFAVLSWLLFERPARRDARRRRRLATFGDALAAKNAGRNGVEVVRSGESRDQTAAGLR